MKATSNLLFYRWIDTRGNVFGKHTISNVILENIVFNYPEKTHYKDIYNMMNGNPYNMKRNEHVDTYLKTLKKNGFIISQEMSGELYYLPVDAYQKFLSIFKKLLTSPNRVDMMQTPYFKKYITVKNLESNIKDWSLNFSNYIREGLNNSKTQYEYLENNEEYKNFINLLVNNDYMITIDYKYMQKILQIFQEVPILTYVLLRKEKGVPKLLKWLNEVIVFYPDMYVLLKNIGEVIFEEKSDNSFIKNFQKKKVDEENHFGEGSITFEDILKEMNKKY